MCIEWINVNLEMPVVDEDVLVWCSGDGKHWFKKILYIRDNGKWSEFYDVKYWAYVPDPT